MTHSRDEQALTVTQSFGTGAIAGMIGALIDQPLLAIKIQLQQRNAEVKPESTQTTKKTSLNLNPAFLYRGFWTNSGSMIPITGMQMGLNHVFKNIIYKDVKELSLQQEFICSFAAGMGSAVVACPAEFIIIHQNRTGLGFIAQAQQLAQSGGVRSVYRGLFATAVREGCFSSFLLAASPFFKALVLPYCVNNFTASLASGSIAGVLGTVCSQPSDNVKTIQQTPPKNMSDKLPSTRNIIEVGKSIYANAGFAGLFAGIVPRGVQVVAMTVVMGVANECAIRFFRGVNGKAMPTEASPANRSFLTNA